MIMWKEGKMFYKKNQVPKLLKSNLIRCTDVDINNSIRLI